MQPLTYFYNAQEHCSTNLLSYNIVLSRQLSVLTALNDGTALLTDASANASFQALQASLLHRLLRMRQNVSKQMKMAQRRYEGNHSRLICNRRKTIEIRQYIYLGRPPMTTSASEHLTATLPDALQQGQPASVGQDGAI